MVECPACGVTYSQVGQHWRLSSCPYPDLSDHQLDVAVGLLLGDGCLNNRTGRPRLRTNMITESYLHFLDDIFGVYGTGVHLVNTASEQAAQVAQYNGNGDPEDYHNVYRWATRKTTRLEPLTQWYTDKGKRFPADLELNPTRLKHWFVGDGCYVNNGNKNYVLISTKNEQDRRGVVETIIETSGFEVGWWEDSGFCISTDDTERFFNYIGDPLPGFEHKWPDQQI